MSIEAQKDEEQTPKFHYQIRNTQEVIAPSLFGFFPLLYKTQLFSLSFCYPRPNAPFPILFPLSKVGQDTSAHEPMLPIHVPTKDLNLFSIHTPFYLLTALTIYFH